MSDSLSMTMSILDEMRPVIQNIASRLESLDEAERRRNAGQQQRVQALSNQYKNLAASIGRVGTVAGTTLNNITGMLTRAIGLTVKWGGALGSLAGVGSLTVLLKQGIQLNAEMEKYRMTLTTVMRSGAQANSMLDWIVRFSERTPFQVQGLAEAATQLEAVGLNARRYLPVIGDMAAAFGGTEERIQMLIRALSFLKSGVSGEAMESLRRFGISRKDFEDRGIRFNRAGQMISSGNEGIAALEGIAKSKFGGLMETQAKTFSGLLSNLKDMANNTLRDTVAPLFEYVRSKAEGLLDTLNRLRDNGLIREWGHRIGSSLVGAAQTVGTVASEVFATTREGGIGAGMDKLWEYTKQPAADFITWFIDALKRGMLEAWDLFKRVWAEHPVATTLASGYAANRLSGGAIGSGLAAGAGYGLRRLLGARVGGAAGRVGGLAAGGYAAGVANLAGAGFATYGVLSLYDSISNDAPASWNLAGRAGAAFRRNIRRSLGRADWADEGSVNAYADMLAGNSAYVNAKREESARLDRLKNNFLYDATQSANLHLGLRAEIGKFGDFGAYSSNDLSSNATNAAFALRMKFGSPSDQLATLRAEIAQKEGSRGRFTFGDRYGPMPVLDAFDRVDDGRSYIESRAALEKEILSLKRQEIDLEAKMAQAAVKTNAELFKRLHGARPEDKFKEFQATSIALNLAQWDQGTQANQLGKLDAEALSLVEQTGLIDKSVISRVRRGALAGEAWRMGFGDVGDYLLGKETEFDGKGFADRFDEVGKDIADDFKSVVDTLKTELDTFGKALPASLTDALTSLFDRAEQMKIAIEWPDPLQIQAKFEQLSEDKFREWIESAVRKALGIAHPKVDAAENGMGVGV